MKSPLYFLVILFFITTHGFSQSVGINETGATPNSKSILDISSSDKGILIPRLSTEQRENMILNTAEEGMLVYDTETNSLWIFSGTVWIEGIANPAGDLDWIKEGTTSTAGINSENVFHLGNVSIGKNTASTRLDVAADGGIAIKASVVASNFAEGLRTEISTFENSSIYGVHNEMSRAGQGLSTGVFNEFFNETNEGSNFGIHNSFVNTDLSNTRGVYNAFTGASTSQLDGILNDFQISGSGNFFGINNIMNGMGEGDRSGVSNNITFQGNSAIAYGVKNRITGAGNGTVYGTHNTISNSGTGAHYGIFSSVSSSSTGPLYGNYNSVSGSGAGQRYGTYNLLNGSNAPNYGVYNEMNTTNTAFTQTGSKNRMTTFGTAALVGTDNEILHSGSGLAQGTNTIFRGTNSGEYIGSENRFEASGTGGQIGFRNSMTDISSGVKVGLENRISSLLDNTIFGVLNLIEGLSAGTSYGTYNQLSGSGSGKQVAGYFDIEEPAVDRFAAIFEAGNVVANESGSDSDFRVESMNMSHALYVDASKDAVGIGQSTPEHMLHVFDLKDDHIAMIQNFNGTTEADGLAIKIAAGFDNDLATGNQFIKFMDGFGNVKGSISGDGAGGVSFNETSDERLKQNIALYTSGLATLSRINPYSYQMKSSPEIEKVGFLAQELYEIFPIAVSGTPDNSLDNPMMVDYSKFTPLLVAAVKEQNMIIKNQEQKIDDLEARLRKLEILMATMSMED